MRLPEFAGTFYPSTKNELKAELNLLFQAKTEYHNDALGIIVPHASYLYSGQVAAKTYKAISGTNKRNFVILGVDHHGSGVIATSKENWQTPLGTAKIDRAFSDYLTKEQAIISDEFALKGEHSIEVQIPFLQYLFNDFEFVPIQVPNISYNEILELAKLLSEENYFFIATSDLIHYGSSYNFFPKESLYDPNDYVKNLDNEIIEQICKFDGKGFLNYTREKDLTLCGATPIALLLEIAKNLGCKKIEKIMHDTSFSSSHDVSTIVGYGGLVIS